MAIQSDRGNILVLHQNRQVYPALVVLSNKIGQALTTQKLMSTAAISRDWEQKVPIAFP